MSTERRVQILAILAATVLFVGTTAKADSERSHKIYQCNEALMKTLKVESNDKGLSTPLLQFYLKSEYERTFFVASGNILEILCPTIRVSAVAARMGENFPTIYVRCDDSKKVEISTKPFPGTEVVGGKINVNNTEVTFAAAKAALQKVVDSHQETIKAPEVTSACKDVVSLVARKKARSNSLSPDETPNEAPSTGPLEKPIDN